MVTSTFFPHAGIPSDRKVNVTSQISSPKSWYTTNCSAHRVSITCCCMHSLYISFTCVICIQNKYDFSRLLEEGVEKKVNRKAAFPNYILFSSKLSRMHPNVTVLRPMAFIHRFIFCFFNRNCFMNIIMGRACTRNQCSKN